MRVLKYPKQRIVAAVSNCGQWKVQAYLDPNGYPNGHEAYVKMKAPFYWCVDTRDQMPHEIYVQLAEACGVEFC